MPDNKTMPEAQEQIKQRSALSGWPMIIGWIAMIIFALHASTHMVGAGDTWVAMACGRHFLNHGVDTVEPFSAYSHKSGPTEAEVAKWPSWAKSITKAVGLETVQYWHPTGWVNQNWLTHVIFYWLSHESPFADANTLSFNTLVYWKFAIYILTIICVYYTTRLLGGNSALSAVFACFALFVGRSFFDIRPAGFSNLMVAAYLLALVLATYRNKLYIWLIVPVIVFWCNLHGGYIYAFIMLVPFAGLNLLTSFSKKRFRSIGLKGLYHTAAAGFVAFIACIIFNPFHLTNLTHTFVVSVSEHAKEWRTINEWHPAFEWNNPVGDEIPFLIMYIICWLVLVLWVAALALSAGSAGAGSKRKASRSAQYERPRVDLPLMVIAALTIYMAVRSRRFIPIAAIVACPVLAMFIDQVVRMISATVNNMRKKAEFVVSPMPRYVQMFFTVVGAVAVVFFGAWWGFKFKRVYLDSWPTDTELNSVFMRMTASDHKPFSACKFIRDNKLKGRVFNYWTDGGFLAWGQKPDPDTGKTPLQLVMDGRAQAAYDRDDFQSWMYIIGGGTLGRQLSQAAKARGKKFLSRAEYERVGKELDKLLTDRGVWVVLMPANQFDGPFVRGLERNNNWRLIFFNNKQKLFVDIRNPRAQELFNGITSGQTVYPNEFSKNLIVAHILLAKRKKVDKGLNFAIEAFKEKPSQAPMQQIISARRFPALAAQVDKYVIDYYDDFLENKNTYSKQHGYHNRTVAALVAGNHLYRLAKGRKDQKSANLYVAQNKACDMERRRIIQTKRW